MNIESRKFPIGFARRGARSHSSDNTIDSFKLALEMGAPALESDVWITADGKVMMGHDGIVRTWRKTIKMRAVRRVDLPSHIPSLVEFYEQCGTDFQLLLDVKDPNAAAEVVNVSRRFDPSILQRLWLCHPPRWQVVAQWRDFSNEIVLVDSTRIGHIKGGLEQRHSFLTEARIDALNMNHKDWTIRHVEVVRSSGLLVMAWGLQRPSDLKRLLEMNVDAIFSDHVDRMKRSIDERVAYLTLQQDKELQ